MPRSFRGEVFYQSKVFFTPFNVKTNDQAGFAKLNASINLVSNDKHWTASLFGKNITNKRNITNATTTAIFNGFSVVGYYDEPARYGLTLGYKF